MIAPLPEVIREMFEDNLPMIRVRLEQTTRSKNPRHAAEAERLLARLNTEYGPGPLHAQS